VSSWVFLLTPTSIPHIPLDARCSSSETPFGKSKFKFNFFFTTVNRRWSGGVSWVFLFTPTSIPHIPLYDALFRSLHFGKSKFKFKFFFTTVNGSGARGTRRTNSSGMSHFA